VCIFSAEKALRGFYFLSCCLLTHKGSCFCENDSAGCETLSEKCFLSCEKTKMNKSDSFVCCLMCLNICWSIQVCQQKRDVGTFVTAKWAITSPFFSIESECFHLVWLCMRWWVTFMKIRDFNWLKPGSGRLSLKDKHHRKYHSVVCSASVHCFDSDFIQKWQNNYGW